MRTTHAHPKDSDVREVRVSESSRREARGGISGVKRSLDEIEKEIVRVRAEITDTHQKIRDINASFGPTQSRIRQENRGGSAVSIAKWTKRKEELEKEKQGILDRQNWLVKRLRELKSEKAELSGVGNVSFSAQVRQVIREEQRPLIQLMSEINRKLDEMGKT